MADEPISKRRRPDLGSRWHEYIDRPINFLDLASNDDRLARVLVLRKDGSATIDFKDPNSLRILTSSILKEYFDLRIELPENRLCPTVTLRVNYLMWIETLLKDHTVLDGQILGVDIGTGASCIFPLLGCRMYKWKFFATEIDAVSVEFARKNIEGNQLQGEITLHQSAAERIFVGNIPENERYPTVVPNCNGKFSRRFSWQNSFKIIY
eukprot:TRINITY_DN3476_c0_g1_i1.p1 TRINITY_DN3476_c0_g1~~TRINITY_DN3476_c0_g1_i1.p1  ORF type:complete len:209 (-),score=42.54 TRINITY_DN3476_c0_g1_i1:247-873(-)